MADERYSYPLLPFGPRVPSGVLFKGDEPPEAPPTWPTGGPLGISIPGVVLERFLSMPPVVPPQTPTTTVPQAASPAPVAATVPTPQSSPAPMTTGWTPEEETFYQGIRGGATGTQTTPTPGEDPSFAAARQQFQNIPKGEAAAFMGRMTPGKLPGVGDYEERLLGAPPGASDPRAISEWNRFKTGFEGQKRAEDLARAQEEQALQETEIDPRTMALAQLALEQAKAGLLTGQGEEARASGELMRARAATTAPSAAQGRMKGEAAIAEVVATDEGRRMYATAFLQTPAGQEAIEAEYQKAIGAVKPRNPREAEIARRVAQSRVWAAKIEELKTIANEPGIVRAGYNPLSYGGGGLIPGM